MTILNVIALVIVIQFVINAIWKVCTGFSGYGIARPIGSWLRTGKKKLSSSDLRTQHTWRRISFTLTLVLAVLVKDTHPSGCGYSCLFL